MDLSQCGGSPSGGQVDRGVSKVGSRCLDRGDANNKVRLNESSQRILVLAWGVYFMIAGMIYSAELIV